MIFRNSTASNKGKIPFFGSHKLYIFGTPIIFLLSLLQNYEFIDAEVLEDVVDDNKVNFTFNIKESKKFYVERINVYGNNVTEGSYFYHIKIGHDFDAIMGSVTIIR